jgi:hypothetical protein
LIQRPGLKVIASQIAILSIPFRWSLALQISADTPRQKLRQMGEFAV